MKLFCRKFGNGPPIIILHGLYGSSDNWVTIARKISGKFTVYLPDLRNHGQSPHSPDHSYKDMARDIYELTEDLGLKKFVLAGHSMGGKTAMCFAMTWPEKINALVVIDISPFGSDDPHDRFYSQHKEILDAIISPSMQGLKSRSEAEKILAYRIESEKTRQFIMKNLARNSSGILEWKINAKSLLANLSNITCGIVSDEDYLNPVQGFPVIFMKGEESDYLATEEFGSIMKIFPSAELVRVDGAGHWLHAERPDSVEKVIFSLL